jgi:hypothetical protein
MDMEKVWPTDKWPAWVPAAACVICVFALSGTPLYIAAQVNAASNFGLSAEASKDLWWTRYLIDVGEILQYVRASVLITTSITIAGKAGTGVATSGLVVGAFWGSYWIGALSFRFRDDSVAERRVDFLIATTLMLVSTVAAAMVALRMPPYTIPILCLLQAVSGATGAYASVFRDMVRKFVYDPTEVTRAVTRRKLCQAIGTSCGPLLSAAAGVVVVHPDQGYVAGILVLGPLFVVYVAALFILYPADLRPLVRVDNQLEEENFIQGMSAQRRDVMLLSYLAASMLLTVSLSCVENATVAILSMEFDYTYIQGGIFVSISFISYPFVDYAYDKVRKEYAEENILRSGIVTVAVASLLLSGTLCSWAGSMRSCLWFILFADMLMFPLLQLCQGILQGWALRYATHEGPLSASTMTILRVSLCSVARGCGPWLSRSILENAGRNYYTAAQIMLISIALLIVEVGVTPFTEAIKDGELTGQLTPRCWAKSPRALIADKQSPSMDSTAPSTPQFRNIV